MFQDVLPTVRADAAGGLGSGPPGPEPPGQPVERVEADAQEGVRQPGEHQRRGGGGRTESLSSMSSFGSGSFSISFSKRAGRFLNFILCVKSSALQDSQLLSVHYHGWKNLTGTAGNSCGSRSLLLPSDWWTHTASRSPDDAFSAAKQIPRGGIRVVKHTFTS